MWAEGLSLGRVAESAQSGRVAEAMGQIGSAFCSEAEAIVQSGTVFRAD